MPIVYAIRGEKFVKRWKYSGSVEDVEVIRTIVDEIQTEK